MSGKSSDPPALHRITPYFTVKGVDQLIEFLVSVFSARIVKMNRYDDNTVQHARLQFGDSLIMLNEMTKSYPANTSQMHIFVDDVAQVYQSALDLGGVSLMAPNIRPHGDKMAGFKDPCGNIWWIASQP